MVTPSEKVDENYLALLDAVHAGRNLDEAVSLGHAGDGP